MECEGRVALVTGAQQGIGRAMVAALAAAGADVAVNWHDDRDLAEQSAELARAEGRRAVLVRGDVSSVPECRHMVAEAVDALGRIDILINNAGMFPRVAFLDMEEADYDFVVDINQKGTFFMTQAVARHMVRAGTGGSIVNLSSRSIQGMSPRGAHYTASKLGIVGITRAAATELAAHGIRVNAIAPGLTDTAQPRYGHSEAELEEMAGQIPLGRMARPDEIAGLAVFLCSSRAAMVTGQVHHINGGTLYG
ncbi:MAG: SDR family oxidoreductase [Alphaproteobacteria bacterium]|nr:SDR family oxidoreductase [Alphaproteobacteria bacterium]